MCFLIMHLSMVNEIVDRKLQTNEFEDDDEIPDELLDPIMFILIKELKSTHLILSV